MSGASVPDTSVPDTLTPDTLQKVHAYWRAANYRSVGQIYLRDNPLLERPRNHANIHVRGYREEGTTTTPFDMVVLNNVDRCQRALDAIRRIPSLAGQVEAGTARYEATLQRHKRHIAEHGDDMAEMLDWRWSPTKTGS